MKSNNNGAAGECFAVTKLLELGYKVIEQNFHSRYGEIDIIAVIDDIIAFVEVKTRAKNSLGTPGDAVSLLKQKKIILTSLIYFNEHNCDYQPRYDVFEVVTNTKYDFEIESFNYIENAFIVNEYNTPQDMKWGI